MGLIRRILAVASLSFLIFCASVYFTFFHHPPAGEILQNQIAEQGDIDQFNLDPDKEYPLAVIARAVWNKWMYQNNYVSIGNIYDTCGKSFCGFRMFKHSGDR